MFIIVYIYLHLLPRTPDCVMAEARIPENFGDTQIRVQALDFMGLGTCMPREAWRLPSPQTLHQGLALLDAGDPDVLALGVFAGSPEYEVYDGLVEAAAWGGQVPEGFDGELGPVVL